MTRLSQFFSFKIFVAILLLVIFTNLIYLDLFLGSVKSGENQKIIASIPPTVPLATSTPLDNNICPQSCLAQILIATSSVKTPPSPSPTPKITPVGVSPVVNYTSSVKEFFVPLGTGTTRAGDWEDINALQATIDTNNYNQIKSVTFEVSLHIPTGNETVSVRLYNVTDKHQVWFSEVSASGGTAQFVSSPNLTLDKGNKTYRVQAKTSLQYEAVLDQSRIHIITY